MAIIVSFMEPGLLSSDSAIGLGTVRAAEVLTLGTGVTTATSARDGEIAMVCSTEGAAVLGARGTTPNAAATTAVAAQVTDAGFPVPPGILVPIALRSGDKLNFKPLA